MAVAARDLDMGEVWEDNAVPWELPIANHSAQEIHVLDFRVSCTCLAVEPRSLRIGPGETAHVRLTLDLTHRMPAEVGAERRSFRLDISPVCHRDRWPQAGWVLRGIARSRVVLNALMIQFGEIQGRDGASAVRKVSATAQLPVRRLEARVDPPHVTAQVRGLPGANNRFELTIRPSPSLPPGPFRCEVILDTVTAAGERRVGARLPVEGIVLPPVQAVPARLLLGSQPVGCSIEATILLLSRTAIPWTIERWQVRSPGLQVAPQPAYQSDVRSFRIIQRIVEAGDHVAIVRFSARIGEEALFEVPVEVWYHGESVAEHPSGSR